MSMLFWALLELTFGSAKPIMLRPISWLRSSWMMGAKLKQVACSRAVKPPTSTRSMAAPHSSNNAMHLGCRDTEPQSAMWLLSTMLAHSWQQEKHGWRYSVRLSMLAHGSRLNEWTYKCACIFAHALHVFVIKYSDWLHSAHSYTPKQAVEGHDLAPCLLVVFCL